jgi:hypothetical protein
LLFGVAHSEVQTLTQNLHNRSDEQVFVSLGGGYRTLLKDRTVIGFNGFWDTARFANRWVSSGGAGFELAAFVAGHDTLDMNINWYGDISEGDLVNPFRNGPANFDMQLGYSHQLFDMGPDLRLFGTLYKFDDGSGSYGWQAGGEIKSANGVLAVKAETAFDPVNDSYQSVGAYINIGFEPENLFKGKNPFVMPEPIFSSPRNMNRLTQKITRNYRNTTHGIYTADSTDHTRQINVVNNSNKKQRVYVKFLNNTTNPQCQTWGKGGQYRPNDFPGWTASSSDCYLLYADLDPKASLPLPFKKPDNGDTIVTISMDKISGCNVTQAEITVHNYFANEWHDGYDISLVNGFNYKVKIDTPYVDTKDPYTEGQPYRCLKTIQAASMLGNSKNAGVFGLGNDQCCASCKPPAECCSEWGDKIAAEAHPTFKGATPTCLLNAPYAPCPQASPQPQRTGNQPCDARPRCQMDGWHSQANGNLFTVTFDE